MGVNMRLRLKETGDEPDMTTMSGELKLLKRERPSGSDEPRPLLVTMATLAFEDYSLYSDLSDDELLQLAIQRSLEEGHQSDAPLLPETPPPQDIQPIRAARNSQHQNALAIRRNSTPQNAPVPEVAHYSSPNPPREKPPDPKTFNGTISHFLTGSGRKMVTYRNLDDTIAYIGPEPTEDEEPIFLAIREGDAARVKALALQPGTNLLQPSKPGWLPIHQAAWFGQTECLRALISAPVHGRTPAQSPEWSQQEAPNEPVGAPGGERSEGDDLTSPMLHRLTRRACCGPSTTI
uniref:Uncharacterized protein n=1 Tax=Knipowitschia caucasica TaxID=637954 RepID=A0AAV2LM16_KNICA